MPPIAISASITYLVTSVEIASDLAYTRWRDVSGQKNIALQIKACMEVHILLANYFGVTSDDAYEVHLGTTANTQCFLEVVIS